MLRHRLITRGPPARVGLHRLNRPDTEWVEKAIQEDVARGQLIPGSSLWGSPAFPANEGPDYKAVRRSRRLVVDYRALNRVTERRFFVIPNGEGIKSTVAGSRYISVGDLKEGFNQVENEPEAAQKMAVLAASGTYLPRGLTFGPTNGLEEFQEMVFIAFRKRPYKPWYFSLDDLAVATGGPPCLAPGPSGAADVVELCREGSAGEVAAACRSRRSGSGACHSPIAHGRGAKAIKVPAARALFQPVGWMSLIAGFCVALAVWGESSLPTGLTPCQPC